MNDKPKTWNIPVRTAEGRELQRKYAEAWPGLEGTKAMIQLNLDDIEAVLDRANDDADRVSVYEYREALNAVYRTAMRILSEKMAAEQAIHNEAFQERQRIVAWIRVRLAHSTLDDRVSFRERGVMINLANALERGEHER